MAKKKAAHAGAKKKTRSVARKDKRAEAGVPTDLSDAEKDLVSHMETGWQLETDSLGGCPVLRNLKSDEVVRPASANRNTVKALEERGLIAPGNGEEPLKILWWMKEKK